MRAAQSFARDKSGNVAMMWALMGSVLVGLVGLTVDFTRAQAMRAQMQNAVDGAALVAERSSNLSMEARTAAARAFFDAEMGDMAASVTSFSVSHLSSGGHQVDVQMPMPVTLARVVDNDDWTLRVNAVAEANASPPIEVALVLDNTGSMAADMQSLRTAASDLATDLMSLDGDTVRVALVPFVAQVNIGNGAAQLAWMDTTGVAPMNGEIFEDRLIGHRSRNTNTSSYRYTASDCSALSTLPYFDDPDTGADESYTGPYRVTWRRGSLLSTNRCFAFTPEDGVNYLTLFDLVSNEDWKGCVEARPEPYDITDAAPVIGTPATLFVPFFWLDTGGDADQDSSANNSLPHYRNNDQSYLSDTPANLVSASNATVTTYGNDPPVAQTVAVTMTSSNAGAPSPQEQREARFFNLFKYRNTNGSLDASAPNTRGPNRGCPTPIVPLTTNSTTIQANIAAMQHWMGGGTNQAEGLAWGWRVLSPSAPFTEGAVFNAAHDNVRKVIVLMSDGENTNVGTDAVMETDFSAYNYLGFWRTHSSGNILTQLLFGLLHGVLPSQYRRDIDSSNDYVDYVDGRQADLCENIKDAGIEIYVVRFRDGNAEVMEDCATDDEHYFEADNAQELQEAFDAIGTGIGSLRLTH